MYTTKHAQRMFDVKSDQTIRNWVKEFEEFFTVSATPGKGVDLQFSAEDMQILDLISSMRADRRSSEEIHVTLKSGQRGTAPELSPDELDVLTGGDYEKYLSTQVNEMNLKINQLSQENEELRNALQPLRENNIQLATERTSLENQLNELRKQLEDGRARNQQLVDQERNRGQEQLERLLREIGELRYKIGQLEKDQEEQGKKLSE